MQNLIIKYFSEELTPDERKTMFTALEDDANLKQEFESMQNIQGLTAWVPQAADQAVGIDKLLAFKEQRRTAVQAEAKSAKQSVFPWKHLVGYAAAVCLAIVGTWLFTGQSEVVVVENTPFIAYEEFTTPSGQRASIKLHDGTVVWLNAGSRLRYPNVFDAKQRKVELEGEAYFEVAHNAERPFLVQTGKVDIKVLGTKFNVFAYANSPYFNTTLLEGAVEVMESGKLDAAVRLQPNEAVTLEAGQFVKSTPDNLDYLLWKEGIYAFDDETFADIMKKLELYYNVSIRQTNKKLDAYRFSGKFRQRDGIENVLRTLQKIYRFTYTKNDELNQITIK